MFGHQPEPTPDAQFVPVNLNGKRRKRQSRRLTENDWLILKDEIVELYTSKRLSLSKMQDFIQEKHDFIAT